MTDIITLKIDEMSTQIEELTKELTSLKQHAGSIPFSAVEEILVQKPLFKMSDLIEMSGGTLTKYIITKDIRLGRIQTVPRGRTLMFPRDSALSYLKIKIKTHENKY